MPIIIQNEWYKDFFTGLNSLMWERAATPEWTQQETNFLVHVLNVSAGATLLDIPCGFGRHTLALARQGFRMTGVDLSTDFIQKLRQQTAAEQLPIQIIHGDMLTVDLGTGFDGAYCLGNSFGYVAYAGMELFIRQIAGALKSGGRLVINSGLVAESILPDFPKSGHYVLGDLTMDVQNTYDIDESCMNTELTYTQLDQVEKQYFKHYVYTLSEIKRLLARYGLQTVATYSSTERTTYQLGDKQLFLVAQKE